MGDNTMKLLSVLLLVLVTGQLSFGAKPGAKPATVAEAVKRLNLDAGKIGRGKSLNTVELQKHLLAAMPKLTNIGSSSDKITKVVTYNAYTIDMIVKASESTDQNFKDLVSRIVDLYADKIDTDVNSSESIRMGKITALLALDKVEKEYMEYATDVVNKMSEGSTAKDAMEAAAAKYASKKKMTVEEWLKKLEECIA